jgi:CubicO group peptidase (beta-lactamase class C family)
VEVIDQAWLDDTLARCRTEAGAPGMVAGVWADDRLLLGAQGVANLNTGASMLSHSLWITGSIQKVWTTALAMTYVDDGTLELSRRVVDILPWFRVADPEVTDAITVRHLLNHSSGIDAGDLFWELGEGTEAAREFVRRLAPRGQLAPLGAFASYNNSAFVVLRLVIEEVARASYDDALAARILDPLRLRVSCTTSEQVILHAASVAVGSVDAAEGGLRATPVLYLPRVLAAGGTSLLTTAEETLTFFRIFLDGGVSREGRRILSECAATAMMTRTVGSGPDPDTTDGFGLGWRVGVWNGEPVVRHGGGSFGGIAAGGVLPGRGVAWICFANRNHTGAPAAFESALLERELGAASGPPPRTSLSPAEIAGRYLRASYRIDVTAVADDLYDIETAIDPDTWHMDEAYQPMRERRRARRIGPGLLEMADDPDDRLEFFEPAEHGYELLWNGSRVARRDPHPAGS